MCERRKYLLLLFLRFLILRLDFKTILFRELKLFSFYLTLLIISLFRVLRNNYLLINLRVILI